MRFTLEELAGAAGGTVLGDPQVDVDGLSVDTRSLEPGAGFVALVATRDGHDFIPAAVEAGASAVVASTAPPELPVPVVRVDDTSEALLEMGRLARERMPDRVVGVTGSVGKTSTKDLLAAVLGTRWVTAASERSFNNEIGVPLTLLGAPEDVGAAVVEMGARGLGHIALLCDISRPTAAVVTAVADAHLEMFGDLDEVARAKGELVEALPRDGTAVLNADDPRVAAMAGLTPANVLTFGVGPGSTADVRADLVTLDGTLRPHVHLHTPWGGVELSLSVCGAHQVANAVAAAACGLSLGVDIDDVVEALEVATISGQRMEVGLTPTGALLIDDAYNANPTSTRAALDALAAVPGATQRVAVLGMMAELGGDSDRLHREVADHAAAHGIRVVSVGAPGYGIRGDDAVDDVEAAIDRVGRVGERDAVLVKGSRVAALERVAAALRSPTSAVSAPAPGRP